MHVRFNGSFTLFVRESGSLHVTHTMQDALRPRFAHYPYV